MKTPFFLLGSVLQDQIPEDESGGLWRNLSRKGQGMAAAPLHGSAGGKVDAAGQGGQVQKKAVLGRPGDLLLGKNSGGDRVYHGIIAKSQLISAGAIRLHAQGLNGIQVLASPCRDTDLHAQSLKTGGERFPNPAEADDQDPRAVQRPRKGVQKQGQRPFRCGNRIAKGKVFPQTQIRDPCLIGPRHPAGIESAGRRQRRKDRIHGKHCSGHKIAGDQGQGKQSEVRLDGFRQIFRAVLHWITQFFKAAGCPAAARISAQHQNMFFQSTTILTDHPMHGVRICPLVFLLAFRYNRENKFGGITMEPKGFIRDMLDVKILILFVLARTEYPAPLQSVYELCYQDDKLSYFDVCEALPQLVASGHVEQNEAGEYLITDKGRQDGKVTEDSIAAPVMQRALIAVEKFNRSIRRDKLVRTEVLNRPGEDYAVVLSLDDEQGNLMTMELMSPTMEQARRFARVLHTDAELLYQQVMEFLLERTEGRKEKTGKSDNFSG